MLYCEPSRSFCFSTQREPLHGLCQAARNVREMVHTGGLKLDLPVRHLLIRGALAGGYLGIASSMASPRQSKPVVGLWGHCCFPSAYASPFSYARKSLPGSFALLPCATANGKANACLRRVLTNWGWVFLGNLTGSTLYAASWPHHHHRRRCELTATGTKLMAIAEAKTNYYAAHGWPVCSRSLRKACSAIGW